jgi:hypothetical protein
MQAPHRATWHYFKSYLPAHFMRCPKVVKDAITTDINDLMQQSWQTSTDGVDIFCPPMCRLRQILQVCFHIIYLSRLSLTSLIKINRYCSIAGTTPSGPWQKS